MTECRVTNTTGKSRLEILLAQGDVPTLPMVAQKLVDLCHDENVSFQELGRVIESDPGLAARLLRVANSAYYGLRHKVSTLDRVLGTLGLKYVKTIALGFHLATALSSLGGNAFNMHNFWRQSILRGALARLLAHQYCPRRQEEAFLIGLLQDCGIPFLAQALGTEYARIWNENQVSPGSLFRLVVIGMQTGPGGVDRIGK